MPLGFKKEKNALGAFIRQPVFRKKKYPHGSFSIRLIARRKRSSGATLHRYNQGYGYQLRGEYNGCSTSPVRVLGFTYCVRVWYMYANIIL